MAEPKRAQWYVQLSEGEQGPMTSQNLRGLAEAGKIHPDTPIRKEGMAKAIPASKVRGLLQHSPQTHITESQTKSETEHSNFQLPKENAEINSLGDGDIETSDRSNSSESFFSMAEEAAHRNDLQTALKNYSLFIETEFTNKDLLHIAYTNRGLILIHLGSLEEGKNDLLRASELGSDKARQIYNEYYCQPSHITTIHHEVPIENHTGQAKDRTQPGAVDRVTISPWYRFFARLIDYGIIVALLMLILAYCDPRVTAGMAVVILLCIYPIGTLLWVFIESCLLSTLGTTPGKSIFKMYVRSHDGHILSFDEASARSLRAWSRGFGCGISLISIIASLIAYRQLKADGVTAWDKAGCLQIRHEKVGASRAFVGAMIFLSLNMFGNKVLGSAIDTFIKAKNTQSYSQNAVQQVSPTPASESDAESTWRAEQAAFFAANPQYRDNPALNSALRAAFKELDTAENAAFSGSQLLIEAKRRVEEQFRIREKAVREYRILAEQGNPDAQNVLGVMYYEGKVIAQDYGEALKWYYKAAEQGNPGALFNLGIMYYSGQGVPRNLVQAYMWYNLSAAQGLKEAGPQRDLVAAMMTPAQIAEAQALARNWKPRIGYAWSTFTDTTDGFQVDFPCKPEKQQMNFNGNVIKTYACEEDIDGTLILYQITSSTKSNGRPIQYAQSDITLALKNYIIGNLIGYGVDQGNINFNVLSRFKDTYQAIHYSTNALRGGIVAEGISCLVNGKHFKIGVMYEPSCQSKAKRNLEHFLNSFNPK